MAAVVLAIVELLFPVAKASPSIGTGNHTDPSRTTPHAQLISASDDGGPNHELVPTDLANSGVAVHRWHQEFTYDLMIVAIVCAAYFLRLRVLAGRLRMICASARLNERERIARELHDTLLQGVQGLILRLQAVADRVKSEPQAAHCLIEQALACADAMLEEGRDCVRDLRAIDAAPCELSKIFLRVVQNAPSSVPYVCVTVEGAPRQLHPRSRREFEQIGIEAIRNCLCHARASRIEVEILFERHQLSLHVSDDGIGIDPAIASGGCERHFGLRGMRERALLLHGAISIASRANGGTEIELVVPAAVAYSTRPAMPSRSMSSARKGIDAMGNGNAVVRLQSIPPKADSPLPPLGDPSVRG